MARLARLFIPDHPQFVILRARAGHSPFVDDVDCTLFVECLRDAAIDHRLSVHAWSLTPAGVHLVATPTSETSLPRAIQSVGRRYVAAFNRRHGYTGTLWEGRFRATVIEAERYLLSASRYVETMPVRLGLVAKPGDYRWSSYQHHLGVTTDKAITDHRLFWALGNTPFDRQRTYGELCEYPLDDDEVKKLVNATLKGWVLGSESFCAAAAKSANRRTSPLKRGRPHKALSAATAHAPTATLPPLAPAEKGTLTPPAIALP